MIYPLRMNKDDFRKLYQDLTGKSLAPAGEQKSEMSWKKIIPEYSFGTIKVYVVDGEYVRDKIWVDFTQGGHDKVYNFIPSNEIWIDNTLGERERDITLLHEAYERNLMAWGMNYDDAHDRAAELEKTYRQDDKLDLQARIVEELSPMR